MTYYVREFCGYMRVEGMREILSVVCVSLGVRIFCGLKKISRYSVVK